jgi:hypothetical protein
MRKFLASMAIAGATIVSTGLTAAPAAADPVPPGCSVYVDYQVGSLTCTAMPPTLTWAARVECRSYSGQEYYRIGQSVTGNGSSGSRCTGGGAVDVDIVYP